VNASGSLDIIGLSHKASGLSGYRIEERLHEVSKMALQVNLLKETRRLAQPFSGRLERGVELAV